jgi:phosphoglucosamine mutase
VLENVRVSRRDLTEKLTAEVEALNGELAGRARLVVRPSGTEPVVRVLAEAEDEAEAASLCGRIARLVRQELG